jgi:hypothetical protein
MNKKDDDELNVPGHRHPPELYIVPDIPENEQVESYRPTIATKLASVAIVSAATVGGGWAAWSITSDFQESAEYFEPTWQKVVSSAALAGLVLAGTLISHFKNKE